MPRPRKLSFWGEGVRLTDRGHLRYTSPKELKGKYVHRVLVDKLLEETPFSIKALLPWPYEVHHLDFNKTHNCSYNLLLISPSFHSHITSDGMRGEKGLYTNRALNVKWGPPPDWVLFGDEMDEVPF